MQRDDKGIGTGWDHGECLVPALVGMPAQQQDWFSVALYTQDWQAKKLVNIPVDDMLREGWTYDGLPEEQRNAIIEADDKFGILEAVKQAMRLERLIGGAALFLGVSGANGADASMPLDWRKVGRGDLRFVNPIPRTRIAKTEIQNNPLEPDYGRPAWYIINGQRVHHTRLILFKGDPLLPTYDGSLGPMQTGMLRNDGFGQSIVLPVYDELMRASGTRQAAFQLVNRASVFIAKMDMLDMSGTEAAAHAIEVMKDIVNQINLYRGAVVQRDLGDGSEPITTISPSFGSVPELVLTFIQVLSAASDIPATRFLGQAPGGLNSTGESDLENYYGRLESAQRLTLRPQLMQYLRVQGRSVLGDAFDTTNLDVVFPPLWSLSALEQSQIRTADTANIVSLVTANIITDDEALAELRDREVLIAEPVESVGEEDEPGAGGTPDADAVLAGLRGLMDGPAVVEDTQPS